MLTDTLRPRIEPAIPTASQVMDTFAAAGLLVSSERAREIATAVAAGEKSPTDWINAKGDAGSLSLLGQLRYNAAVIQSNIDMPFAPWRERDIKSLAALQARIARIEAYQAAQHQRVAA